MTRLSVEMLAADAPEPIASAGHAQLGIAVLAGIAVIVLLITKSKLHAFLALTIGSLALGAIAGAPLDKVLTSFSTGLGTTVAGVGVLIALGAILGKMLADSGGADQIVDTILGEGGRAVDAVGDGAHRLGDRTAAVLRGRHRAADPGGADGRQARQLLADADRHPGARGPVRDARPGAAAPRPARRDRGGQGRPGRDAGAGCPRRHTHGDHRRPAVLAVRGPLGGRARPRPDDPAARFGGPGQASQFRRHPVHDPAAGDPHAGQGAASTSSSTTRRTWSSGSSTSSAPR
ncbi:hypothetical protein SAFG77S_08912 [Streptomyces afghaniensis]